MGQAVLPGTPPIGLTLRRSARARRISLRVSGLDGRVTLTLPRRTPESEALGFARQKEGWIRRQLAARPTPACVGPGCELPLAGELVRIEAGTGRAVRRQGDRLIVPGPLDTLPARLEGYLKARARDALAEASDRHAATLGRGYGRLTLRDTRSRWGSCSSRGDLMYSWRLILAPPEVLDYVAAHEVAHLLEMNHGPAFWALVGELMPDHAAPRAWLRREGASLHRFRFAGAPGCS
jgi:predicted metal-dependent hydrolase